MSSTQQKARTAVSESTTLNQSDIKFGKVYQTRIPSSDDPKVENLVQLEELHFSNRDFQLYTNASGHLSESKNYNGKKFFLQFKLEQVTDYNGEAKDFSGVLSLPYQLGTVDIPDLDGVKQAEADDLRILNKFDLVSDGDNLAIIRKAKLTEVCAYICPSAKLKDLKVLRYICYFITLLDDKVDGSKLDGRLSCREIMAFTEVANRVLDGCPLNDKILLQFPKTFANLLRLLEYTYYNVICEWKEHAEPLISSIKAYLKINCLEGSRDWHDILLAGGEESELLSKVEQKLRWLDLGGTPVFEMCAFDQRIHVPDSLRGCQFFQFFLRLIAKRVAMTNDLFSCKKDVEDGTTCSAVYVLCMRNGMTLPEALQVMVDKANELMDDIVVTGNVLLKLYPDHDELPKIIRTATDFVYGELLWYTHTRRYGFDIVFNCIL